MILYPALKISNRVIKGKRDDSHNSLGARIGVKSPTEVSRGFTPDGSTFLNRTQVLGFLKKHDRDTYNKLPNEAQQGLHSAHLAEAYGIEQDEAQSAPKVDDKSTQTSSKESIETTTDLSDKTVIVWDRGGLHIAHAEKLAEKCKKVMFYLADADSYPSSQKHTIASGIPHLKRIHDFWKHLDEADFVVMWDCYDGNLAHWLKSKGYTVFSSGLGEKIEVDKIWFLEQLEKLGLPCPETRLTESLDELCEYLKEHDGETLYLKNLHRGDFESRKFTSMAQSRPFLNALKKSLGSASDTLEVLVQKSIDADCEAGVDTFCIKGEWPDKCLVGYEAKDVCFAGKVFDAPPKILQEVNDAFVPLLKKLDYRCNYSTEIRITSNGIGYYIDGTCRSPSPPGELMMELYENWAEIVYDVARGVVPKINAKAKFGAQVVLTSPWHEENEIHVKFPNKYKQHIKLKNYTVREGEYYCIPNQNGSFFGAVVAWGDTLKEAVDKCCEIASTIEADEYKFDKSMFGDVEDAIRAGEKHGIEF